MKTRASLLTLLSILLLAGLMAPVAEAHRAKAKRAKEPLVIGHRGASGYLPEHTLQAYRLAIRLGADYVEPDLVSTKDGKLIARHEPNITSTTDVASRPEFASRKRTMMVDGVEEEGWFASDFTLAEIKTLRAIQTRGRSTEFDGRFRVPTLQQVIRLVRRESRRSGRRIGIYPETKHPTYHQDLNLPLERRLVRILGRNRLNRRNSPVFIQSFEQANLKQLNRMTRVRLVQLVDAYDTHPVTGEPTYDAPPYQRPYDWVRSGRSDLYSHFATDAGLAEIRTYADGIGPWKPYIVPMTPSGATHPSPGVSPPTDLIQRAHAHGLKIHTWTFRDDSLPSAYGGNPIAEYRRFYALGIDGVFSDFPDTAVIAREFFWLAG